MQLPETLPPRVRELAERVTEGAEGPLEQGVALQQFFRDPANFTYDLRARPGTGQAAILDFLDDRRGYCEQFASTMAVMARHLGIPTRVNETPLRETVTMLRQAVAARAGRRARLQAIWWPRSVLAAVQILLAHAGSRPRAVKRFRLRGLRALTARAR